MQAGSSCQHRDNQLLLVALPAVLGIVAVGAGDRCGAGGWGGACALPVPGVARETGGRGPSSA